jgi:hypothetical protein
MIKYVYLTAVFFIIAFFSVAQNPQTAEKDSIIFDKLIHDYGTMVQGADGTCEFVFTNKGQKPLILSNVRASCGCTVPSWPQEPILPGKTGIIKVGYNTSIIGGFSKIVTVVSNASNSQVILTIKGNVAQKQ